MKFSIILFIILSCTYFYFIDFSFSEDRSALNSANEGIIKGYINGKEENDQIERKIGIVLKKLEKNLILENTRGVVESRIYTKASPAVVLIVTNDAFGSGVIIDNQGYVITNWHVVRDYDEVVVVFKPKTGIELKKDLAYVAKVLKIDDQTDLALLKINSPPTDISWLPLGDIRKVEVGQDAFAIGHPAGEVWTYTKGIISQIRPDYEWSYNSRSRHKGKVIQTQTPINPGNSGGPLLNDEAEIIGVNSFGRAGEGLNYAVAVDVIQDFLMRKESSLTQTSKEDRWGKFENKFLTKEFDENNDGIPETIGVDLDQNGKLDTWFIDRNQDGILDYMGIDGNENGKMERKIYDYDHDGVYETHEIDLDENGVPDLIGVDTDGDYNPDRYAAVR